MGWEMLARYAGWAVLVLGVAGSIWWGAHTIHDRIYNDGVTAENARWEKREITLSEERNRKLKLMQDRFVEFERDSSKKMTTIETNHLKEKEQYEKQKAIDIAAARSGALKLHWGSQNTKGRGSDRSTTTEISGTTAICNGKEGGELPAEITANLLELSTDADRNTRQLAQCQEVVIADRNTPPPKPN